MWCESGLLGREQAERLGTDKPVILLLRSPCPPRLIRAGTFATSRTTALSPSHVALPPLPRQGMVGTETA